MANPARTLTARGRTLTLDQWAAETGISKTTLCSRIDWLGWDAERALTTPVDRRFRRGGRPRSGAPRSAPRLREDAKGVAFARWRSFHRDHYRAFGPWGEPETLAAYRRFCAEWASGAFDAAPASDRPGAAVAVAELVLRWWKWADVEYRKLGKRTAAYHVARSVGRALADLYGTTPVDEFTPTALRAVRGSWVESGFARTTVNDYTGAAVRCFRWGAAHSLVPAGVVSALEAVEPLKAGRTAAPERSRRRPATDADVTATVAKLPDTTRGRMVAAMIQIQRLAGLRPQHLAEMRVGNLERTGEVWKYTPPAAGNKTLHVGKAPVFYFGPRAQALLAPFLAGKGPDDHVFVYLHGERPRRLPRDGYARAVAVAAEAAGVPHWTPHQLRHALATEVAARFASIDHAAAAIGDNAATAAAVYVHVDPRERAAIEVARAMG